MNTTNTKTNKYIKTTKDGQIYFDPTCDNNTDVKINHSKDHFNVEEKEFFFEEELHLVIKNGVNYFD